MTDNEIIKALECCSEPAGECCCEECPLHHREDSCTTALIKKALELTNRLNEKDKKNERIIELNDKLVKTQSAEIERLQAELEFKCDNCENIRLSREEYRKAISQAKSEAVKEFADKLKQTFYNVINGIPKGAKGYSLRGAILHDTHLTIDHVKKEMVGDDNA